ncbi:MAG: bifunctional diaminohydroxyphosphoribosylaminopyrimidine deaminase/5-amino-6-(5-phosphoribosylamino)uracil reductase RibD [Betaproteobacteria bacterium]
MSSGEVDRKFMLQALALAHNALFTATPNPRVGCVIVRDGRVIGTGWTQPYGGPHAEQHALERCTEDPAGATAYVTLEPCDHVGASGRSESCTTSLLRARVARVVAAMADPNPRMAGASLQALRAAGVEVESGLCEDAARELNPGFISRMTRGRPWVRVKMAASLDGRTALADGTSQWITGSAARADGHAWRARACAVLTGIGTVLQDDPQLTVREVATPRQPQRIVVDRHAQTPHHARILQGDPVWLFAADWPVTAFPSNVETIVLPDRDGRVDLGAMLDELGRRQINELHVEAGAKLSGTLLALGLVDELLLYFAPCLLGDAARGMFGMPALTRLDARIAVDVRESTRVGDDWRVIARIVHRGQPA